MLRKPSLIALAAAVAGVLVALGGGLLPAQAAPAPAAASFTLSASADSPTAVTGTAADFTIGYACSGAAPCDGVTITVPLPEHVSATQPSWGWNWWKQPRPTNSTDVESSQVAPDGTITFAMKPLAPGTTGTLGVRYTPTTQITPNGTKLNVTASAAGASIDPSSADATMTLTTTGSTVYTQAGPDQIFNYLDRDLTFKPSASIGDPYGTGADGIGTVDRFALGIPVGAEFVSAKPAPESVSATEVVWKDVPASSGYSEPGRREVEVVLRFPSSAFADKETIELEPSVAGSSVSGAPFTASNTSRVQLLAFTEKLEPHVQVLGTNYAHLGEAIARGAEYSFNYYLNNWNSTVPSTSAIMSSDMAPGLIASRMSLPKGATLTWTSSSGKTGTVTATDEYTMIDMGDLGMPEGDRLARFEVELGAVEAPGTREFSLFAKTTDPSVSRIEQCAKLDMTSASGGTASANGCGSYRIVDPFIAPNLSLYAPNSGETFRPGDTVTWQASLSNQAYGNRDWQPVLYFLVPKGTKAAEDPFVWRGEPSDPAFAKPEVTVHPKAVDGQDLVEVRWSGSPAIEPGDYLWTGEFRTVVTTAPAGTIEARLYGGDARGPVPADPLTGVPADSTDNSLWTSTVLDDRGIADGGSSASRLARSAASAPTGTGASLQSALTARGSLDSEFVSAPRIAASESGKAVTYSLPIRDTGNVPLTDIVVYDILPHIGDTGVSEATASQPRGSQFAPILQGAVTAPPGFTVEYSASTNPCRPEVHPSATGCVDDWTATPADYASVRALRFVQEAGASLAPGAEAPVTWSMEIAQTTPAALTAFNSAAFSATRADNAQKIAAEPMPVGVEIAVADLGVRIVGGDLSPNATSNLPITVSNDGPSDGEATVTVTAPKGLTLGTSTSGSTGWTCTIEDRTGGGQTATCVSDAPLPQGFSGSLPLTVTAGDAGTSGTITAEITGRFPDPETGNNRASADFRVTENGGGGSSADASSGSGASGRADASGASASANGTDANAKTGAGASGTSDRLSTTGGGSPWIGITLAASALLAGGLVLVLRHRSERRS